MTKAEHAENLRSKAKSFNLLVRRAPEIYSTTQAAKAVEQVLSAHDRLRRILLADDSPTSSDRERLHFLTLALPLENLETVEEALLFAQSITGSPSRSKNLGLICLDFLATTEGHFAPLAKKQKYLRRLERALGLRLIAVMRKVFGIVYGYRTLEQIAGVEALDQAAERSAHASDYLPHRCSVQVVNTETDQQPLEETRHQPGEALENDR